MELINLTEEIRELMEKEINNDENLYISNRLSEDWKRNYKNILLKHVRNGDSQTFAEELKQYILKYENISWKLKRTPENAHKTLADGEFNRYYILALCKYAIQNNIPYVIVYRAKKVEKPRIESEKLIWQKLDPKKIYKELKNKPFNTAFSKPNSWISIKLP